jgi:hypothetical protein
MKRIFILAAGLALAGCQSSSLTETATAGTSPTTGIPTNYREIIAHEIRGTADYQRGIKNAQISNVESAWAGLINGGNVPTVCVKFGPNGLGGVTYHLYKFPNGRLAAENGRIDGAAFQLSYCGSRTYSPFAEIEK